ncbi:hypothetical protein Ae201684P_007461 [Aphanomyces euteiches]|nr:hypothetical protein Ae201684P_007461 [Aphanomyces euteiches]
MSSLESMTASPARRSSCLCTSSTSLTTDRAAERYLWTIMAAWNAPPIAGGYAHVSASLGAKTSRYRLTFARDDAPPLLYTNGRLVDEIIFQGKCYRVYGKG